MHNFIELQLEIQAFDPWADIISQDLADIGFESFSQENPELKAYILEEKYDEGKVRSILDVYGLEFEMNTQLIASKNWNKEWESNFHSLLIDDRIYVRAPFHEDKPNVEIEILLTPKMSFGTGHHATTSMMMKEMLNTDLKSSEIIDVGCGTAILAILAEKLGAAHILAIDNDDWAVLNSVENAEINNCHRISVEKAVISDVKQKFFNVILANINRNVIMGDLRAYVNMLNINGHMLLSGFQEADIHMISELAKECSLKMVHSRTEGEWRMLHFIKDIDLG